MHVLYINDELATSDGSNYHANGILGNLQNILGAENVRSYPQAVDGSQMHTSHKSLNLQKKHKNLMQLIRMVRKTYISFTRSRRLCRTLEQSGWTPTHILARTIMFDTTALRVARHFKAKLICEVNTPMYYEHCIINQLPFQKVVEAWEKKLLSSSDYIYAVSNVCRDMLCRHYELDSSRFVVIPNGYEEALYSDAVSADAQPCTDFTVTFIGSLKPWHGIHLLCQTAELLQNTPGIRFMVAGDGSEREQVEQYCFTHSNMTYLGKLPLTEMSNLLLASDLGIMPYENMNNFYFSPLKMFDMIGAGLPFIGTNQGQIHDICTVALDDSFLIDDCSPSALAEQITTIANSPELYAKMKAIVAAARTDMTWKARTEKLINSMKNL